jgi:hypothetical protein
VHPVAVADPFVAAGLNRGEAELNCLKRRDGLDVDVVMVRETDFESSIVREADIAG